MKRIIPCLILAFSGCDNAVEVDVPQTLKAANPIPTLQPWTVICDEQGHFNFIDEELRIFPIEEWSTYEEAYLYCGRVKQMREARKKAIGQASSVISEEERRKYNEIASRQWRACPQPTP